MENHININHELVDEVLQYKIIEQEKPHNCQEIIKKYQQTIMDFRDYATYLRSYLCECLNEINKHRGYEREKKKAREEKELLILALKITYNKMKDKMEKAF